MTESGKSFDLATHARGVSEAERNTRAKAGAGAGPGGRSSFHAVGDRDTRWKKALVYGLLILFALMYIYPFIIQVVTAFKTNADAVENPLSLIPNPIDLRAFARLRETNFPIWFMNSVIVTLFVTAGRVLFCSMAGYALARLKFRGREAIFTGVLAVMAVPGIVLFDPQVPDAELPVDLQLLPGADRAAGGRRGGGLHHEAVL